jgi:hypothetical protein
LAVNIDSYEFGLVVINGQHYTSDVIIFPDRVRDNWGRRSGHQLCLEDLAGVIAESPEVLIVGTGAMGLVKVLPGVKPSLETCGIKLIAEASEQACQTYNRLCHSRKVVAALHLTC